MITTARFPLYLFSLLRSNFFQNYLSIHFIIHGQGASVELWIHGGRLLCTREGQELHEVTAKCLATATRVLSNFPSSSVTWCMHTNHEPIIFLFYNIHIILSSFHFSKPIKSLQTCILVASLCKQIAWPNSMTLLLYIFTHLAT